MGALHITERMARAAALSTCNGAHPPMGGHFDGNLQ